MPGVESAADTLEDIDNDNADFDAGIVAMESGSIVKGILLDRDGAPVSGVAIGMKTAYDTKLNGVSFKASYCSVTNGQGQFEFPPAKGKCHVFVDKTVFDSRQMGSSQVTGKKPPFVDPIKFSLEDENQDKTLKLRELTGRQTVSGTIRWDNGSPAVGIEVQAFASPNVKLASVISDSAGNYEIELPRPLTSGFVSVWGAKDELGKWHSASRDFPSDAKVNFSSVPVTDGDQTGQDWVLRTQRSLPFPTVEYEKARREFQRLQRMSNQFWQKLQAAEKNAATPEDAEKAYMELDPRNAMAKHYLAFEEKYRGKPAAFLAINAAMASAVSVGNPETEAAKGRNRMLSRVLEHYMDQEKLAETFNHLSGGPAVPERDKLLDMASKHSPHRSVRGEATIQRAIFAMQDIREAEMLPVFREYVQKEMKGYPKSILREVNARLVRLENVDIEERRTQVSKLLDVIDVQYADIRSNDGSFFQLKLSEIASRLRYSLNNIAVGKPVPDLGVLDMNGNPIRLSEFQGTPIVLTFCFDHNEKLESQDLAAKYAGKNVQFVTLVSAQKLETFWDRYPQETLEGIVSVEKFNRSLPFQNWLINTNTTFLIDADGILRCNGIDASTTEKWLNEMLK